MTIIFISLAVIGVLIVLYWRLIREYTRMSGVEVDANNMSLLPVSSGPAYFALKTQLKSDEKYYLKMYSAFVFAATNDPQLADDAVENALQRVGTDPDPSLTLACVDQLENHLGALVQNATVFAIAATCTYYIMGVGAAKGVAKSLETITGGHPYIPVVKWSEYVTYLNESQPETSIAARKVLAGASRRRIDSVVAVMGYLIDQGVREFNNPLREFQSSTE